MLETTTPPPAEVSAAPPAAPAALGPPPSRWRRRLRWVVVLGLCYGLWEILWTFLGANFHTVLPDRVYRCAQPSARAMYQFVQRHGIKTVVNLRGCCPVFGWYQEESKAVQDLGITQEDIILSAKRLPSASEIRQLVEVLERAESPLLLHCRRGADRTGLASVLALILLGDLPYEQARAGLGWRQGHFPLGGTENLDEFFTLYEAWLKQSGDSHSRERFRHWLTNGYEGGWCRQNFLEVKPVFASVSGDVGQPGKITNLAFLAGAAARDSAVVAKVGQGLSFQAKLSNPGPGIWKFRPHSVAGMHLGVEVFDQNNKKVQFGRAGLLHRDVQPGEIIDLTVLVSPLLQPGRYRLRLDMLEERHCWFQQAGAEPFELELDIRE